MNFFVKKKSNPAVVYLTATRVAICSQEGLFSMDIDPSWIVNMDVKKLTEMEDALKTFLEKNAIKPTDFLIVLSVDVCFEKDWPGTNCDVEKVEIDKFVDAVPFEYVKWKSYKVGKGCKVVCVNKELYEAVQTEMERLEFSLIGVVPQSMTGVPMLQGLDGSVAKALLVKIETLRTEASLIEPYKFLSEKMKEEDAATKKKTIVLISVFSVLITILIVMVIIMKPFASPPKKKTAPVVVVPKVKPTVSPSPTPQPSASVSAILKVHIFNGSKIAGQAGLVQKQLTTIGIQDFTVGNLVEQNKDKTKVTFSTRVTASDREKIVTALEVLFFDMTVLEEEVPEFDVNITTGVQGNIR